MPSLEELGKLIAARWDLLLAVIVLLGGILTQWRKGREQHRKRKIASGEFPFLVVKPYSVDVVKQLMEGLGSRADDPLADFNIRYQVRQQGKNVRQDLERSFEQKPWVIILGRSGLGKTREAAHLAQGLSEEGWTVLKLMEQGWLDVPRQFPEAIRPQDKLLFVIDDLNRWIRAGNPREIHRDAEDLAQPLRVSVQERLLRVLEFFEQECRFEVRVIATARNEPEEREKLQFEKYPQFWQRFQQYELAQPEDGAIVSLLDDRTQEANISANPADFPVLASRSDGTFRNMVENLRTVQFRNQSLNLETLAESLDGMWRRRYNAAVNRYPVSHQIYDAVELLQLLNVPLSAELVQKTAVLLVRRNGLKRLHQQWQIRQALPNLIQTEQILQPRDGQIEGKGRAMDAAFYIPKVLPLLVSSKVQSSSDFYSIGNELLDLGQYEAAIASYDEALKHKPDAWSTWAKRGIALRMLEKCEAAIASCDVALECEPDGYPASFSWYLRGYYLNALGRHEEAITSYDEALKHKADFPEAWYRLGFNQVKLGRNEEALASFDQVLKYKADYHEAWNCRGLTLVIIGRDEEALASFDQALKYKADYHEAWNCRGATLGNLGRYEEALASYDQALEHKPDYYEVWNNRGNPLSKLGRYEEAIASYDRVLEGKPDDHEAWNNRGNPLSKLGRYEEAIASYDKALEIKPDDANVIYGKACVYGLKSEINNTVFCLKRAIFLDSKYREMAKTDTDFDAIRENALFQVMMETSAEESHP